MGSRQKSTTFTEFISYCEKGLIKSGDVVSFDLFDTVFVRGLYNPQDIFLALGHELVKLNIINISPEEWQQVRIEAELKSRIGQVNAETTLIRIYSFIPDKIFYRECNRELAYEKEIEIEKHYIQVIPIMCKLLQQLNNAGVMVCFTTDMYLPEQIIKSWIDQKVQIGFPYNLFVSSSHSKNKYFGHIYDVVKASYKIKQNTNLFHIGDSLHSDVIVASKFGFKGVLYNGVYPNRFELDTHLRFCNFNFLASLINGASKTSRSYFTGNNRAKTIYDVGVSVAGPLLFGFVAWILKKAKLNNTKRLYFLARDGQILKQIADNICSAWGLNIDNRYLYASRQALHPASVDSVDKDVLDWMFDDTHFLSIEIVFNRVNCKSDEFRGLLEEAGFFERDWNNNLSIPTRKEFRSFIESNNSIKDIIVKRSSQNRNILLKYLEQEGLFNDNSWAIVDIGWNGRLQRSLSKILQLSGKRKEPIVGYYFNLINKYKAFEDDVLYSYVEDNSETSLYFHTGIIEIFVTADHGSTKGYKLLDSGIVQPILLSTVNLKSVEWGITYLHQGIINYTSCVLKFLNKDFSPIDFLIICYSRYRIFKEQPSKEEAIVFGDFLFSEQQTDDSFHHFAPKYRLNDIFIFRVFGRKKFHAEWDEAVYIRLGRLHKLVLKSNYYPYRKVISLLKKLLT